MTLRDAILCAIASSCIVACLDLSPVRYGAKDAGMSPDEDAGDADAATSDATAGNYAEECLACLMTMCGMALDTCNADPKCSSFAVCMTETKCWNEKIVDFANPPMCITTCSVIAGVTNQVDPALGAFVSMLVCAQGPTQCAPACAPVYVQ